MRSQSTQMAEWVGDAEKREEEVRKGIRNLFYWVNGLVRGKGDKMSYVDSDNKVGHELVICQQCNRLDTSFMHLNDPRTLFVEYAAVKSENGLGDRNNYKKMVDDTVEAAAKAFNDNLNN